MPPGQRPDTQLNTNKKKIKKRHASKQYKKKKGAEQGNEVWGPGFGGSQSKKKGGTGGSAVLVVRCRHLAQSKNSNKQKKLKLGKDSFHANVRATKTGRVSSGFWGKFLEICIRTFTVMYSHLRPLCRYGYSGCIHTLLLPIHTTTLGELLSGRIHAAHSLAPGRIQDNIPGDFFMYWFRAMTWIPNLGPPFLWGACFRLFAFFSPRFLPAMP